MKKAIISLLLGISVGLGAAQAQLKIDFTVTGGPVEPGYQGYFATDKSAATFTAQSYDAFGTKVTIKPTWPDPVEASSMRMIDRGADTGLEPEKLLVDWIGSDTRVIKDPMTLKISGLPAGAYQWVSYHHDSEDQTGIFEVTVNDAAGSKNTGGIDISNGPGMKLAEITKFTTKITSNGKDDVTLVFHQTSIFDSDRFSATNPLSIFVMNAFELTAAQ